MTARLQLLAIGASKWLHYYYYYWDRVFNSLKMLLSYIYHLRRGRMQWKQFSFVSLCSIVLTRFDKGALVSGNDEVDDTVADWEASVNAGVCLRARRRNNLWCLTDSTKWKQARDMSWMQIIHCYETWSYKHVKCSSDTYINWELQIACLASLPFRHNGLFLRQK